MEHNIQNKTCLSENCYGLIDIETRNFGHMFEFIIIFHESVSKHYPQTDKSKQELIFEHLKAISFELYLLVLISLPFDDQVLVCRLRTQFLYT